jgi:hypothetical protein
MERLGKYVLEQEMARTDEARIFRATLHGANGFERTFALKILAPQAEEPGARPLAQAAKMLVALTHPTIAPTYEVGIERGVTFVCSELVEGATLAEVLAHATRLSAVEGAYVGIAIYRALAYARRDKRAVLAGIHARSVMIDDDGHARLVGPSIAAHGETTGVRALATLLLDAWGRGASPARARPSEIDIRLLPLDDVVARAASPRAGVREEDELGQALQKFLSGIDTNDVARTLAEKARAARATRPPLPEGSTKIDSPQAPHGSRTLAARRELVEWVTSGASVSKVRTPISLGLRARPLTSSVPPPPKVPESLEVPGAITLRRRSRLMIIAIALAVFAVIALLGVPVLYDATRVAKPTPGPRASVPSARATQSPPPAPSQPSRAW